MAAPRSKRPPAKERDSIAAIAETVSAGGTPSVLEDLDDAIKEARDNYTTDPLSVQTYREYVKGEQFQVLSPKQQQILQGLTKWHFADNVCYQICAESRDRLQFLGWICADEAVQEFLNDYYKTAKVSDKQNRLHFDMLRDGNTVAAINWDNQRNIVQLYMEAWWDTTLGIFVLYDADENPILAVKEWPVDNMGRRRRLIWFEDTVVRLVSIDHGNTWIQHTLPNDTGWPIDWVKLDDTPLHIPYAHFANGARDTGIYGVSEISGGVLAFQDQLNGLQWDMSGAGRLTAFQMITASGITLQPDPNKPGEFKLPEVGPGQFIWSPSKDTRFGAIGAGDLSQILKLYDKKLQRVSQMTRTPHHRISGGDWPSGEALFRSEQPAIGKADAQESKIRDAWVAVGHKATEVYNRFGRYSLPDFEELDEDAMITAVFLPTERRDPLSRSVIVNNLKGTISIAEALRIMGYEQESITKILKEMKEEVASGIVKDPNPPAAQGSGQPGGGTSPQQPRSGQNPPGKPAPKNSGGSQ